MESIMSLFVVYIAIFLFGLILLKTGIQQLSYKKMKLWLMKHTENPLKGFIIGIVITAILQSSSTTIVITVSLTAAGLLTFKNTIAIILGANVGTTVTAEIMSFSNQWLMWGMLLIGFCLLLIHQQIIFSIGCIVFGLGTIFTALYGFESLVEPIKNTPFLEEGISTISKSTSYSLLFGTIVTGIIQSSSAFTGMIMSFMNEHLISLQSAIIMVLGANIGTCFTAILASIGSTKEAKWTAYAHVWINVIGVLLFLPIITWFSDVMLQYSSIPGRQLAHASVVFNLVVSLLLLPFVKPFAGFIQFVSKKS
jgi:phosphate:Na+ symporter